MKIDVAVVFFHQFRNNPGMVDSGIGLNGILVPEQEHGGILGQDDGPGRDLPNECLGIVMVVSRSPRLLAYPANEG